MSTIDHLENVDTFLSALKACDDNIPHKKGVGEKDVRFDSNDANYS